MFKIIDKSECFKKIISKEIDLEKDLVWLVYAEQGQEFIEDLRTLELENIHFVIEDENYIFLVKDKK